MRARVSDIDFGVRQGSVLYRLYI